VEYPLAGDFLHVDGEDNGIGTGYLDIRLDSMQNPIHRVRFGSSIGKDKGTPFARLFIDWPLIAGKRMSVMVGNSCRYSADHAFGPLVGSAAPPVAVVTTSPGLPYSYIAVIAYNGASQPEYQGWAAPGSATSAAAWAIVRHTYTGALLTATEFADGNLNFDNVWDDRATLTYS
jgi:hypothetical protein